MHAKQPKRSIRSNFVSLSGKWTPVLLSNGGGLRVNSRAERIISEEASVVLQHYLGTMYGSLADS